MFQRYSTDYANEVHQLIVSVSKHYWVTKDDVVNYQVKPIVVDLANAGKSTKSHLVFYIIRDHFSGLFYLKATTTTELITAQDFLHEAWALKAEFAFHGMPTHLAIPDTVEDAFPGTRAEIASLGISLPKVTSGFHAGVRDVRTLEARMGNSAGSSLNEAIARCSRIGGASENEESRLKGLTKAPFWKQNLKVAGGVDA